MSLTKGEHVLRAYRVIRISGLTSKPTPQEVVLGLSELEDMMNEFRSRNICSTYFFEETPDVNTDSEISAEFNNATQKCLGVRLAPYFGKEALLSIQKQATQALSNWGARTGKVNMITPSNRQPRGSGNNFRFPNWVRFYRFDADAPIECDTFTLKVDAVDFFLVDFTGYLLGGATITSFVVESTNGIALLNTSQDGAKFNLECKGVFAGYQTVTLTVTTSTGRVNPQKINFNIT